MPYLPTAIGVTVHFLIWFWLVPYLLLPRTLPAIERLALGFFAALAASVVAAEGLSALSLWEPATAWALVLLVIAAVVVRASHPRTWTLAALRSIDSLQVTGIGKPLTALLARLGNRLKATLELWRHPDFFSWVACAGLLIWTAWLRFGVALRHLYLTASDAYLHLAWIKYLQRVPVSLGTPTHMFQDGVYPYGYHAILSVLATLNFLDPHAIIRFAGPIGGVLLVLSIGYAAWRAGARPAAVLLGMAVLALGGKSPLPADPSRMISPLPQEFAAAFVLPGAIAAWRYLRDGNRPAMLITLLAGFLTAAIHTYSSVYLALSLLILALAGLLTGAVPFARALRLGVGTLAAAALGMLPIGIGRLLGIPFQQTSLDFVVGSVARLPAASGLARFWTPNPALNCGLIVAGVFLLGGLVGVLRGNRDRAPLAIGLSLVLILLFTQAYGRTGFPVLMDPNRSGLFFSLFLALAAGLAVDTILAALPVGPRLQPVIAALLIAAGVARWFPVPPPPVGQYEYDSAAEASLAISREYPRLQWTIVAPQEQLPEVLGLGFHTQLFDFGQAYTVEQMSQPSFRLATAATGDLFVFVEKWPLGSDSAVVPDGALVVSSVPVSTQAVYDNFYLNPAGRRLVEARVWGLMEAYCAAHPGQVTIFRDDERFRVYHVTYSGAAVSIAVPSISACASQ